LLIVTSFTACTKPENGNTFSKTVDNNNSSSQKIKNSQYNKTSSITLPTTLPTTSQSSDNNSITPVIQDSSNGQGNSFMQQIIAKTSMKIAFFFCGDYNADGRFEAFAFMGDSLPPINDADSIYAVNMEVWTINSVSSTKIFSGEVNYIENLAPHMIKINKQQLLLFSDTSNFTNTITHLWFMKNGNAVEADNDNMALHFVGGNVFHAYPDAYDHFSDGTGHTWKRYYLYWNGSALVEYGGIKITQTQLRSVNGCQKIINSNNQFGWNN